MSMSDVRLFPLPGGESRNAAVDRWFDAQPAELASIAKRWFDEMRACGADVTDLLHDGHPTACVGDLAFGYVNVFTQHVNVGFFLGSSLNDPAKLLQGTGRFMRHVRIAPSQTIDDAALRELVRRAYAEMRANATSISPP